MLFIVGYRETRSIRLGATVLLSYKILTGTRRKPVSGFRTVLQYEQGLQQAIRWSGGGALRLQRRRIAQHRRRRRNAAAAAQPPQRRARRKRLRHTKTASFK